MTISLLWKCIPRNRYQLAAELNNDNLIVKKMYTPKQWQLAAELYNDNLIVKNMYTPKQVSTRCWTL